MQNNTTTRPMESKQTATEWLIEQVKSPSWSGLFIWHKEEIFQQAITMSKEQIIEAYDLGSLSEMQYPDPKTVIENGEQYYNETYNK